jgi:hypothetical protein
VADEDLHILPGAFGDEPKTVPLVVYEGDGQRRVVGEATITPGPDSLGISGHIVDPDMAKKFTNALGWMDGFSLLTTPSPKPPHRSKFEKEHPDER